MGPCLPYLSAIFLLFLFFLLFSSSSSYFYDLIFECQALVFFIYIDSIIMDSFDSLCH